MQAPDTENSTLITSAKSFSDAMTLDLTDEQIKSAWSDVMRIREKWIGKFRVKFSDPGTVDLDQVLAALSEFEDEVKTTMAEHHDLLVTVDTVPILEGQPPVIEFIGALPSHSSAKYGMDHEKKTHEVQRATDRGEDYLGQRD